ncbi:MAG: 3-deoxy-D-manno-octulosonic acid kinase [Colwellia sp.]
MRHSLTTKNKQLKIFQEKNSYCIYDSDEISTFEVDMLNSDFWHQKNAITGSAQGRGTTWFVQYNESANEQAKHWVLRHYYRGGLIGKFNKDSYWFSSQETTRAAQEFSLLEHMQKLQLPAPKPIAYRVTRHGLFYRADLLSSRIENAQDLVAILLKQSLSDDLWYKIGYVIKRFHDQGIYHHDLNAHNILISLINKKNDIYLIDFDRCELRSTNNESTENWRQANMARLQRSFIKERSLLTNFRFFDKNWQVLLKGYNGAPTQNEGVSSEIVLEK